MTTGIYNNGYYNQPYNYQTSNINNQSINFTRNNGTTTATDTNSILTKKKQKVEKDDGNIGFLKAAGNLLKGGVKFFTGMFTDEQGNFSIGQTLKTAAIAVGVGAVTVLTAGTAVPAMIAAAGIGVTALGTGKAIYDIATADTDAEAEQAWQSLGSNATAGALALVGAKAVAKSTAGASASEYEGIGGYFKAGKKVFSDSASAVEKSYSGIKTAYKSGSGFKAKGTAIKTEVESQYNSFSKTVKGNYNKAVYGTKAKINNDADALDKEITKVQKEKNAIKDKTSSKYKELEVKETRLQAQQEAIRDINNTDNWSDANNIIEKNKAELANKKAELAKATESADKTNLSNEIDVLNTKIKQQEATLSRRVNEAQHIQSSIKSKKAQIEEIYKQENPDATKIAKLEKEIADLEGKQEFELPTGATKETVKAANERVTEQQKNVTEAENDIAEDNRYFSSKEKHAETFEELEKCLEVHEKMQEALEYCLERQKAELENVTVKARIAQNEFSAQEGSGYAHVPTEIGRIAVKNPATAWLTLGIAGRQFGNKNAYTDFYSQLTADEKTYFKSLPEEQQQALLEAYESAVA